MCILRLHHILVGTSHISSAQQSSLEGLNFSHLKIKIQPTFKVKIYLKYKSYSLKWKGHILSGCQRRGDQKRDRISDRNRQMERLQKEAVSRGSLKVGQR